MKRIWLSFITVMIIFFLLLVPASADYLFRVPRAETTVIVNKDGTLTLEYTYEFENLGQPIDFIDIGTPNSSYNLAEITVLLNGEADQNIKVTKADYKLSGLRHGITLEMGSSSIPTGGTGNVFVTIPNIRKNLYKASSERIDGEEVKYAGFRFSPNYFGMKFVSGTTDYLFRVVMPEGSLDNQVFYYRPKNWPLRSNIPEARLSKDGLIIYKWHADSANIYTAYEFGGKFPARLLTTDENVNEFEPIPTLRPTQRPTPRPTQRSGYSGSGYSYGSESSSSDLAMVLILISGISLYIFFRFLFEPSDNSSSSSSYRSYTPPVVKADGNGVKRGLTAVEAAVLLGADADRILTMILYGLCRKGAVVVKSHDPFEVEIADPLPLELKYELRYYEKEFLKTLNMKDSRWRSVNIKRVITNLLSTVYNKINGFSLEETKTYYKDICKKAWQQVKEAGTPELKSKMLDEEMGWIMLDKGDEKKIERTFANEEVTLPSWWWRLGPEYFSGIGGEDAYNMQRTAAKSVQQPSASYLRNGQSGKETIESRLMRAYGVSEKEKSSPAAPVLPGAMQARMITTGAENFSRSITESIKGFSSKLVEDPEKLKSTFASDAEERKIHHAAKLRWAADQERERKQAEERKTSWWSSSSSDDNDRWSSGSSCDSCACACACDSCACACAGGGR